MQKRLFIFLCIVATTLCSVLRAQVRHTGYYRNQFSKINDSIFYIQNNKLFFGFKDSVGSGATIDTTSLSNRINSKVNITDTTAMLTPYLREVDTTAMLTPYLREVDTTAMLTPYLHEVDTTAMLTPYLREVDTTAMLTPYLRKVDTLELSNRIDLKAPIVSPSFTTPSLGVATATSLNTGTTLNGKIFAKSTTDIDLSSTAHALTVGGEANSTNMAIGEYSTGVGLQGRNNGAIAALFLNPFSGDIRFGSSYAGVQNVIISNTDAGTGSYIEMGLRNGSATADGLLFRTLGTGFTTSGMNFQDGGFIATSTSLSGGLSIGTQASADFRVYSNNTLRTTWAAATGDILTTAKFTSSGGGIGYSTGAGGTVTQLTSRATAVTLNKLCGNITMFSAAVAINGVSTFTLTNSFIEATDFVLVRHISATNGGAWGISVVPGAGSCTISVRNNTTASITEATPLRFIIIKATTN